MLNISSLAVVIGFFYLSILWIPLLGQNRVLLAPSTRSSRSPTATRSGTVSHAGPAALSKRPNTATLAAGIPLRVEIDHRYRMHKGRPIQGRLIEPVYSGDHAVLPANARVDGVISDLTPVHGSTRFWARMNGDFTPLKKPVLHFTSIQLPDGSRLPVDADASERTADLVKMGPPGKKKSRLRKITSAIHAKAVDAKNGVSNAIHSKHKSEKALQILYGQLPYHPQDIWTGTQFDADLVRPLTVPDPKANDLLPITPPHGHVPPGTLDVRLITPLEHF